MTTTRLADRIALVTGGANWIGRETSARLASEGALAVVADIDADAGRRTAAEIQDAGGRARFVHVDVSDEASVEALAAEVLDSTGAPHVVVNNASTLSTLGRGSLWELDLDEWERSLRVNLTGMWLVMRAFAPAMMKRGSGAIVNMSSAVVYVGRRDHAHYVAAKAGVIGLTRAAAREMGPSGIRVNAIAPGFVDTGRNDHDTTRKQAMTTELSLPDLVVPADVAAAVAYLASDDAVRVTGQVLSVDSGLSHH